MPVLARLPGEIAFQALFSRLLDVEEWAVNQVIHSRKRICVHLVGGILEAVAIHEFLGRDRCARPLRESGDAFELDLAVKLLERSAVFFALLHRCLGHLIGKGGPPRNEEKDQVNDFHQPARIAIPTATTTAAAKYQIQLGGFTELSSSAVLRRAVLI